MQNDRDAEESSVLLIEPFSRKGVPLPWFEDPRGHWFLAELALDREEKAEGDTEKETEAKRRQKARGDESGGNKYTKPFHQLSRLLVIVEAKSSIMVMENMGDALSLILERRLQKLIRQPFYLPIGKGLALHCKVSLLICGVYLSLSGSVTREELPTSKAQMFAEKFVISKAIELVKQHDQKSMDTGRWLRLSAYTR